MKFIFNNSRSSKITLLGNIKENRKGVILLTCQIVLWIIKKIYSLLTSCYKLQIIFFTHSMLSISHNFHIHFMSSPAIQGYIFHRKN